MKNRTFFLGADRVYFTYGNLVKAEFYVGSLAKVGLRRKWEFQAKERVGKGS